MEEDEEEGEEEEEEDDDEEEDEEEDDDEDEDEEEESEEEDEKENVSQEDNDNCVASFEVNTSIFEDVQKCTVTGALENVDSSDAQKNHPTHFYQTTGNSPGKNEQTQETDVKKRIQQINTDCPAGTTGFAILGTLNVEHDCVVSAVRVESKFSDEDESLGKESMWLSTIGSARGLKPSRYHAETHSPIEVEEEDFEKENDNDDDSCTNKDISANTVWKESKDEEDNKTGGFGTNAVLENLRNVPEVGVERKGGSTNGKNETKTDKEAFRNERLGSSWDFSLEDSDNDLPEEKEVMKGILDEKNIYGSDLQAVILQSAFTFNQPTKNPPESSLSLEGPIPESVSPQPVIDKRLPSLALCSRGTPQPGKRAAKVTNNESDWDSSSESDDQTGHCSSVIAEGLPPVSRSNIKTVNDSGEQQCSYQFCEEALSVSLDKESDDPSPAVSPIAEDENKTRTQIQDNSDTESENFHLENKEESGGSWDSEDESCQSAVDGDALMSPNAPTNLLSSESTILQEDKVVCAEKYDPSKDNETSEDSDSEAQRQQYDSIDATVSGEGVGSDYILDSCLCAGDELDDVHKTRLTAYVPLENGTATVPQTGESSNDLNGEPTKKEMLSGRPTTDDVTAGCNYGSKRNSSDGLLSQTDNRDIDLDPAETDCVSRRSKEVTNIDGPFTQVKQEYYR